VDVFDFDDVLVWLFLPPCLLPQVVFFRTVMKFTPFAAAWTRWTQGDQVVLIGFLRGVLGGSAPVTPC
jgi:hypothetical protein